MRLNRGVVVSDHPLRYSCRHTRLGGAVWRLWRCSMSIGIHFKSILLGFLVSLGAGAVLAIYVYVATFAAADPGRSGKQLFLLLFLPLIVGGCVYLAGLGLSLTWGGLTRFAFTADALTIRGPLRTRAIPWTEVRDFVLPSPNFPRAPEWLVLLLASGRRVTLSLQRIRAAGAEPWLGDFVPGLTEWGLERVRAAEPMTKSILRVRWQLYKSNLIALYFAAVFFFMTVLATAGVGWNYINYERISRSHKSALATITEIMRTSGKYQSTWVRAGYTAWNGQSVQLHREVKFDFAERFKVGGVVKVDYLPEQPSTCRIPDWDLDERKWLMAVLWVPVLWVSHRVMRRSSVPWLLPLRAPLVWAAERSSAQLAIANTDLRDLSALLPARHAGTLVLVPPLSAPRVPGLRDWERQFRDAGIDAHSMRDRCLVLMPDQVKVVLDRIGDEPCYSSDYFCLDCTSADEVERFLARLVEKADLGNRVKMRGLSENASAPEVELCFIDGVLSPVDDDTRRAMFQDQIQRQLDHLYGGVTPSDIPAVDFAALLGVDPADGAYALLIERRRAGPRLWIRKDKEQRGRRAECTNGRWLAVDDARVPRALKKRRGIRTWFR